MDYYKILGLDQNASSKEIEQAYEDLEKMYNPSFNTSSKSFVKYRQIVRAYEALKNDEERRRYAFENKLKEKLSNEKRDLVSTPLNLFDFENPIQNISNLDKNKENYNNLVADDFLKIQKIDTEKNSLIIKKFGLDIKMRGDIKVTKEVSYLDFILGSNQKVNYLGYEECKEGYNTFKKCEICNGFGKVNYEETVVECPSCFGQEEIKIHSCEKCNNFGYFEKQLTKQLTLDKIQSEKQIFVFKEEGAPSVIGSQKSDLIIEFVCNDKESFKVIGNLIKINYEVNKEEYINGINKIFEVDNDVLVLKIQPFDFDNKTIKKQFKNYEIEFNLIIEKFNGDDLNSYLFINKKDLNLDLYLDTNTLNYSKLEGIEYNFNFKIDDSLKAIKVPNKGQKASLGGINGDLFLKPIVSKAKIDMSKYNDYSFILTPSSKLFNLLGGKQEGLTNYGFKSNNSLLFNHLEKKIYILTGDEKSKRKLSLYLLPKLIFFFIWAIILSLLLFLPFNKQSLITVITLLVGYAIILNVIINIEV